MRKFFNRVKKIAIGIGRFVMVAVKSLKSIYLSLRATYRKYRKQMGEAVAFIYALLLKLADLIPDKYKGAVKVSAVLLVSALTFLDMVFQIDPSTI